MTFSTDNLHSGWHLPTGTIPRFLRAHLHCYTTLLPNISPKASCTEHHNYSDLNRPASTRDKPELNCQHIRHRVFVGNMKNHLSKIWYETRRLLIFSYLNKLCIGCEWSGRDFVKLTVVPHYLPSFSDH